MEASSALNASSKRIDVVDVLRGIAIMSILLLHNLEHFDFIYDPPNIPEWRAVLNGKIWAFFDLMVAGKSYAIFALLFGFTFWLMDQKQLDKGKDFRLRFLWRMFLLMVFGLINSLFYEGEGVDILKINHKTKLFGFDCYSYQQPSFSSFLY